MIHTEQIHWHVPALLLACACIAQLESADILGCCTPPAAAYHLMKGRVRGNHHSRRPMRLQAVIVPLQLQIVLGHYHHIGTAKESRPHLKSSPRTALPLQKDSTASSVPSAMSVAVPPTPAVFQKAVKLRLDAAIA